MGCGFKRVFRLGRGRKLRNLKYNGVEKETRLLLIQKSRDESIAVLGRHHGESEANQKVKKLSTFFIARELKGDMSQVIEERH